MSSQKKVKCCVGPGVVQTTLEYWSSLVYFLKGGKLKGCPHFQTSEAKGETSYDTRALVQVRSLALISQLWSSPHYRNGTFRDDMIKNLRNVAVPGTGLPLSVLCVFGRYFVVACLLILLPMICLIAAVYEQLRLERGRGVDGISASYRDHLLHPRDWFSFWRLNCRLATYHSHVTNEHDYRVEDKWTFLTLAKELSVPVTPWIDVSHIICKHRNEEGGLGFQSFANATAGGDWIIQERVSNATSINALLPENAPLSTFRVISSSTGGLWSADGNGRARNSAQIFKSEVRALSCVWRAGRANATTDHKCVMFDVDLKSGVIREGVTSSHWYSLGLSKFFFSAWTSPPGTQVHPDTNHQITGQRIEEMPEIIALVEDAHRKMCPGVPMAGWDVAVTPQGLMLLETNLSCNFFRASFDEEAYLLFVRQYFEKMEQLEEAAACAEHKTTTKATHAMPSRSTNTNKAKSKSKDETAPMEANKASSFSTVVKNTSRSKLSQTKSTNDLSISPQKLDSY